MGMERVEGSRLAYLKSSCDEPLSRLWCLFANIANVSTSSLAYYSSKYYCCHPIFMYLHPQNPRQLDHGVGPGSFYSMRASRV